MPIAQVASLDLSGSEDGTGKIRHVHARVPVMVWIVAVVGFWERAAFWGSKFDFNAG